MTTTTTTPDALSERERLHAERDRALRARDEHASRREAIHEELRRIPRDRREALQHQARTGDPAGADEFDRREAELRAELRREDEALSMAREASQAAGKELQRLHHDRLGEFFENAEGLTQEAAERLAALRADYEAAYAAIEAARAEYALLVSDHNHEVNRRADPAERAAGLVKQRQLSPPPANPLVPPAEAFGAAAIRPPEVEPLAEAA